MSRGGGEGGIYQLLKRNREGGSEGGSEGMANTDKR